MMGKLVTPRSYHLSGFVAWILWFYPYFGSLFQRRINNQNHLVAFPVEAQDPPVAGNYLPNHQACFL